MMLVAMCAVQASEITSSPAIVKPKLSTAKPTLHAIRKASNALPQKVITKKAPSTLTTAAPTVWRAPSYYWAILHNWLYFLSLGLSVPNLPRVISSIVNPDGSPLVSGVGSDHRY